MYVFQSCWLQDIKKTTTSDSYQEPLRDGALESPVFAANRPAQQSSGKVRSELAGILWLGPTWREGDPWIALKQQWEKKLFLKYISEDSLMISLQTIIFTLTLRTNPVMCVYLWLHKMTSPLLGKEFLLSNRLGSDATCEGRELAE